MLSPVQYSYRLKLLLAKIVFNIPIGGVFEAVTHSGLGLSGGTGVTSQGWLRVGSNGKYMFDEIYVFFDIYVVEFWVKQKHIFIASGGFGRL